MIVDLTDLEKNLAKYLCLSAREEIVITRNGMKVARLTSYAEYEDDINTAGYMEEQARAYEVMPQRATYEEYLRLTEASDERYEYIDGEIYLMASPKAYHQETLGELYLIFGNWFQGKICRPMLAPFDITLKRDTDDINVVQPDLMVICDLKEKLNDNNYYMGVPALVVEIISESTRGRDLVKKLELYMSTGVREYWVVNPLNREVCVYLFEDNEISKYTTYKEHDTAVSCQFDGLAVSLDMIFR